MQSPRTRVTCCFFRKTKDGTENHLPLFCPTTQGVGLSSEYFSSSIIVN